MSESQLGHDKTKSYIFSGGRSVSFFRKRFKKPRSTGEARLIQIPPVLGQQATRAPWESSEECLVGRGVRPDSLYIGSFSLHCSLGGFE